MSEQVLAIGELSRRTGVALSALRYYEQMGLLPKAARVSGQRRYPASAVRLVGGILLLRDVGFSLRDIKAFMSPRSGPKDGWRRVARDKVAELDRRIAEAHAARTALEHALGCGHTDLWDCPNFSATVEARLAGTPLETSHLH